MLGKDSFLLLFLLLCVAVTDGTSNKDWSHWSPWSSCPGSCHEPSQKSIRSCFSGTCPTENRVETKTRPCNITLWVAEIFDRFRSDSHYLPRLVQDFYRYLLRPPLDLTSFNDHSATENKWRNFVIFKVGNERDEKAFYNRKYTGPSYSFTTFATHPFTAIFLIDDSPIPNNYTITVLSGFATDGTSDIASFRGSIVWRNYTMEYGGLQIFSSRHGTLCRVFFSLPLTPNSTLELILSSNSILRTWNVENEAFVEPQGGAAVLGYILLSKPVGIKFPQDEIKATMLTMMNIILSGDKSEILERVRFNACNLTRDVANYYHFPLPIAREGTVMTEQDGHMYHTGNEVYFKIGAEARQLAVYNKTYRGPSYIFATFKVHPFTAMFFLGDESGPRRYQIEVDSTLASGAQGGLFQTFEGSVSLRNYTLKYRGAQAFSSRASTVCEVYFFLPLEPNSNRQLTLLASKRNLEMENRAFVRLGGGKAVFGYTLLSKQFGRRIPKRDINQAMFAMIHILVGADYSVPSVWTSWSASPISCRVSGIQTRSRSCTSGRCLQTSSTNETQSRPLSGLKCVAKELFERFLKMWFHLKPQQLFSFYLYKFPTGRVRTSIFDGGGNMFDVGNKVYFKVRNARRQLAVYDKRYTGASYIFETFTIHPFTAFFVIDFDSRPGTYSIEVESNLGANGRGKFGTFDGLLSLRNTTLQYGGAQVYDASPSSVCEVYFFMPLTGNTSPKLIMSTPDLWNHYLENKASVQSKSGQGVLGYILLSKIYGEEVSKRVIKFIMSKMMEILLMKNEN